MPLWKDEMNKFGIILIAVILSGCGRPVHHPNDITVESVLCTSGQVETYFADPSAGLPTAKPYSELHGKQQFILTRLRHNRNQRFGGELQLILDGTGLRRSVKLHGVSFGDWDSHVTPMGKLTWGNATGVPMIVYEWIELTWK